MNASSDVIQRLRDERDERDQRRDSYPPVPHEPRRTLLLIGPSRAGKSTIVRVLHDSLYQTPRPTLYSATREPQPVKINGLRIIDMPGFYDRQAFSNRSSLTNASVFAMLKKQIDQYDSIDFIAFVFHLANGINSEDIDAMLLVKKNLRLAVKMLLIVTHAEEMDAQTRKGVVNGFFQHPTVIENNLRQCFDEEILFLGSLRYESLQQNDSQALAMEHRNVLAMRKKFLQKCFAPIEQSPAGLLVEPTSRYYWKTPVFLLCCVVIGIVYYLQSGHRNVLKPTIPSLGQFKVINLCFPSDRYRSVRWPYSLDLGNSFDGLLACPFDMNQLGPDSSCYVNSHDLSRLLLTQSVQTIVTTRRETPGLNSRKFVIELTIEKGISP